MATHRCSSLPQYKHCLGSYHAQLKAPKRDREEEKKAKEESGATLGSEKHAEIETVLKRRVNERLPSVVDDLSYEARYCLDQIEWPETLHTDPDRFVVIIEEYMESEVLDLDGHPDLIIVDLEELTADVYDWKTGYGTDTKQAYENSQAHGYALLTSDLYPTTRKVTVRMIQPNHPEPEMRLSTGVFDEKALLVGRKDYHAMIDLVEDPNAPRTPHPVACHWCYACGTPACPESSDKALTLRSLDTEMVSMKDVDEIKLLTVLALENTAKNVIKRAKAEVIRRLQNDEMATNMFFLKDGNKTRSVDTMDAWSIMKKELLAEDPERAQRFLSCCSVRIPALEELYRDIRGVSKLDAKNGLESLIQDVMKTKQGNPQLKRR